MRAAASNERPVAPDWLFELLGIKRLAEGEEALVGGRRIRIEHGVVRVRPAVSGAQAQTSEAFGFKWGKRETFESAAMLGRMREWLVERYGDVENAKWWRDNEEPPIVLDAGCGAGMSVLELFGSRLQRVRYLGVDISEAVDVAAHRFAERGAPGAFMQADLTDLPLPDGSVDVIFSEGVMHHTDSTERALHTLARLLRPGGRFLFYVYRRKGPIREFTDDYIRNHLQALTPDEAWQALVPLSKLGQALGRLDVELDVPEDIELLGIPAGRIDVQRFFYWHVLKAFYRPEYSLDELNHINYDWYAPRNAHRQSVEEVRTWCRDARLVIEHENVQDAGITIIARRGA